MTLSRALFEAFESATPDQLAEIADDPEFCLLMARLKHPAGQPIPFDQMDLELELAVRFPYPLEHYQRRALAERLGRSTPFRPGTCG